MTTTKKNKDYRFPLCFRLIIRMHVFCCVHIHSRFVCLQRACIIIISYDMMHFM